MINDTAISQMKQGVVLVNTSRGGLIETAALIKGLKEGKIRAVGLDVYEKESEYFFEDGSASIMQVRLVYFISITHAQVPIAHSKDDALARLISFNNVFISGHQAFFTKEVSTKSSNS